jgi:hypothetical protein
MWTARTNRIIIATRGRDRSLSSRGGRRLPASHLLDRPSPCSEWMRSRSPRTLPPLRTRCNHSAGRVSASKIVVVAGEPSGDGASLQASQTIFSASLLGATSPSPSPQGIFLSAPPRCTLRLTGCDDFPSMQRPESPAADFRPSGASASGARIRYSERRRGRGGSNGSTSPKGRPKGSCAAVRGRV